MVTVLPGLQPDPLGQALGQGLSGLIQGYQQGKAQEEERKGAYSLGKQLGIPEEQLEAFARSTPEQQKLFTMLNIENVKASNRPQRAGEEQVTPEIASSLSETTGGRLKPEQFQGKTVNEAKLLLRAQEVSPESEEQKFEIKSAGDYIEGVRTRGVKAADDIRALAIQRDAANTGKIGPGSAANIAERFGITELQSPEGAAFNASKQQFFGNLGSAIKGNINRNEFNAFWDTFARVGQSPEAQLAAIGVLEKLKGLDLAEMEYEQQLSDEGVPIIKRGQLLRKFKADKAKEISHDIKIFNKQYAGADSPQEQRDLARKRLFG